MIEAWPGLPADAREKILALIRASPASPVDCDEAALIKASSLPAGVNLPSSGPQPPSRPLLAPLRGRRCDAAKRD